MLFIELFIDYWRWHYTTAIKNIFSIWGDFIWFIWNYFSVGQLTKTLFTPWKRIHEDSPGISELFNLFTSIVITFLMRIVGAVIRTVVIAVGLLLIFIIMAGGILFLVTWIVLPVALAITFAAGVTLLTKNISN